MLVLGIESSCDETGVAIVEYAETGTPIVRSEALHSQVDLHRAFGGVVPELASRDHVRRVLPLTRQVLASAGVAPGGLDAIAFTRGPGLAGALLVGAGVATSFAAAIGRPAIGVHHLEGHLLSPFLSPDPPAFPFVALLVSGGHTQLLQVDDVGRYRLLGDTVDDAAGEAFDKSAMLLGLGYPGGPALARLALEGRDDAFDLPRPLLHNGTLDFSFAGLKTAVRTQALRLGDTPSAEARAGLAASTERAIVEVLAAKAVEALRRGSSRRLVVAGGVGANRRLRRTLDAAALANGFSVHYPAPELCTDNGTMIALAAAMRLQRGMAAAAGDMAFSVLPRWPLESTPPTPPTPPT